MSSSEAAESNVPDGAGAVAATQESLGRPQMLGYAVGDLGINLNFQLIGFYLAYFYTDVFGISAAHVAGLFLAARIWDAVNDPLMGYIADRTRTRWGRFRPYVLLGAIPLNLVLLACFWVPDVSETAKLVYVYVTYIMHGMAFTAVGLPYSSMTAAITQDQQERSVISSYRMFFAVVVALSVVSIGVPPFVALFGTKQAGFFAMACIFGVTSSALLLFSASKSKERIHVAPEPYRASDIFRIILKNDALLVLSTAMFLNTCVWVIYSAVALYFFEYVMGDTTLQSIYFLWMLPANVAGVMAAPWLTKRYGKLKIFIWGSGIVSVFLIFRQFVPDQMVALMFAVSMAGSFGQMLCAITQWGMLPDTVEYGQYITGLRSEAIPYAVFSFTQKIGLAVGGALTTGVLAATGYVANSTQSPEVIASIRWLFNLFPAGFSLACLLALLFYKLTPTRFDEIRTLLAAKQTAGE